MSNSLDRLWALIGKGGCRLTTEEKVQMVQVLSEASWSSSQQYSYTLASIFSDFEALDFAGCTPPLSSREEFNTAFNFCLSPKECWRAIKAIAHEEIEKILCE